MQSEHSLVEKVRYYSSVSIIYLLTLLFAWFALHPVPRHNIILAKAFSPTVLAADVNAVYGRPVRIVIPASNVDLPVDPGYFDQSQASWTLSGYRAQFAMISNLANNVGGDTFIYGHNNNYVFGALRHVTPTVGAQALVYTDNAHVFAYSFARAYSLAPDDTSVLSYQGPPIMTIQTCTGSLNEWRTMYQFNFVKVIQ
jgi:sortase (surface protein transpeptidase)